MASGNVTITVRKSDTLKAVLSGLRAASKTLELVPDWHAEERQRCSRRLRRAIRKIKHSIEVE